MADLIALPFSPWSEKARWALDHHHVPYRYETHVPMLGEPWLRLRTRTLVGRVSVPAFVDGREVLMDSFAIARHAEEKGSGASLFPEEHRKAIEGWNARSEAALSAGRASVMEKITTNEQAMEEALPALIPDALRPVLRGASKMGAEFLRKKYGVVQGPEAATRSLALVLEELRKALGEGRSYLFDEFTYADIAMAVVLQFVRPVKDTFIPLGPGTREVWTQPTLAERFADLLEWRDALYEKHRRD